MKRAQKVTWIAVFALISIVNVHCQDLENYLHIMKDLSKKLIDCQESEECNIVFTFILKKLLC